jgi:F0F1-type ATP synthase epsilon subunit
MKLNITSLRGTEYEGDIKSLNIKTKSGEVTILDNHRPLVTVLVEGTAKILSTDNKETLIQVRSGFMEVSPDNAINILMG